MQKNNTDNYKIDAKSLDKYFNQQFADFHIPSLRQFINLKYHNQTFINALTFSASPSTKLSEEITTALEKESILYLHSGILELHKKQGQHWRRDIELKDAVFFTLINYRNMYSSEAQWFKLILKTNCCISVLPINPKYNFTWIKNVWLKNNLLSKIFFYNDQAIEVERKKNKFFEFIEHFDQQIFRRDTRLISQGKKNDKLYIILKGEARIYKQLRYINANGSVIKNVEILYLTEGSIVGSQLFLISSKPVHTIISNHQNKNKQKMTKNFSIEQSENQEQSSDHNRKEQKNQYNRIHVEQGGYQLYDPHQNISNFTVTAQTANLQTLFISIQKLISILNIRCKGNFVKLLQQSYITILRRTHEKMTLQLQKEKIRIQSNQDKREAATAQHFSKADKKSGIFSQQLANLTVQRPDTSAVANLSKLKITGLSRNINNRIDKQTELVINKQKAKINFKQKIESLLEQKLNAIKPQVSKQQIADDLAQILIKKSDVRTQDIAKQNELLQKKTMLLEKRGGWKPGWNQLTNKQVSLDNRRKSGQMPNYLAGLNLNQYTYRLKYECAYKIHETNKIKQQFMKIKSQCPCCTCYDNFQKFSTAKRSMTNLGRTGYKTAEGWGKTNKSTPEQESLQKVYNKMSFLSEKSKEKYNHNIHILKVHRYRDRLERRKSAPVI